MAESEVIFTYPYSKSAVATGIAAAQAYAIANGIYLWRTLEGFSYTKGQQYLNLFAKYETIPSPFVIAP